MRACVRAHEAMKPIVQNGGREASKLQCPGRWYGTGTGTGVSFSHIVWYGTGTSTEVSFSHIVWYGRSTGMVTVPYRTGTSKWYGTVPLSCDVNAGRKWELQYHTGIADVT